MKTKLLAGAFLVHVVAFVGLCKLENIGLLSPFVGGLRLLAGLLREKRACAFRHFLCFPFSGNPTVKGQKG